MNLSTCMTKMSSCRDAYWSDIVVLCDSGRTCRGRAPEAGFWRRWAAKAVNPYI